MLKEQETNFNDADVAKLMKEESETDMELSGQRAEAVQPPLVEKISPYPDNYGFHALREDFMLGQKNK
ncbi:MAG: hypothetical protein V1858_03450 [Candidatus Gottesmanbacteria bacterium]